MLNLNIIKFLKSTFTSCAIGLFLSLSNSKAIKLSVIMPVYNGNKKPVFSGGEEPIHEGYLKQAIDSVLRTPMKPGEMELICVNDGSTDDSLKILKEYHEKDPRVIVIDQQNTGVSGARQAGLDAAKGDYIAFMDSDDIIDSNTYKVACDSMDTHKADIVCFGLLNFSDNGNASMRNNCKLEHRVYTNWFEAKKHRASIYTTNKIYRRELIIKNDVKFFEDVKIAEDEGFNLCAYSQAKIIVHIPDIYYYYRLNTGSAMFGANLNKIISNYSRMWTHVNDYYKKHGVNMNYIEKAKYFPSVYKDEILPLLKTLLHINK